MNNKCLNIAYWASLFLALVTFVALHSLDEHLKNDAAPMGIVSFELCAYNSTCPAVLAAWTGEAKSMAAMSLGIDYLFMVVYPAFICFGLLLFAPRLPNVFGRLARILAWGVWLAGFADAIENYHLFQMLIGQPVGAHQWIAAYAATFKFVVVIPALLAWLVAAIWQRLPLAKRT